MSLVVDGSDGFKALQMEVQVPERTQDVAVPLFKLEEGIASSSAGLVCAKMSGVKKSVIDRANEIVTAMKRGEKVQPLTEILNSELGFSDHTKNVVSSFIRTNWKEASDDDVVRFRDEIAKM